jgi:hypothetical protein
MSNILTFPPRAASCREPIAFLTIDKAILKLDSAISDAFDGLSEGVDALIDQLKLQKDLITGVAALLECLPEGPARAQLRAQMLTVDAQIVKAFKLCDAVVDPSVIESSLPRS